ncbi:SpaA/cell polarity protein [Erysiphe neolycopersici]|uniref:SpaA/cell polarity protein n=1 Tax=Erysiphe neolycopersici TaxID=212602 RepID=A0A420HNP7_9PEZI|nr:SpaA/cell polarity protein [Erysiphe neolycopersici]
MSVRNSPLTPISLGGDDEGSSTLKFPTLETDYTHQKNWAPLASPPVSSSSSTMSRNFQVKGATTSNGNSGAPSSPSSIARPSEAIRTFIQSESVMDRNQEKYESILYEHYLALKRYTSTTLKNDSGNPKPNRARDKLLRLSSVQFQELSTDIFDELVRRQQVERRLGINGTPPPPFLPPREKFHPKRNQARQKLSTLPPPRFRDLATDVFLELERRFPRFSSEDALKTVKPVSTGGVPSRIDLPSSGNRLRRPSETNSATFSVRSNSRSGPMIYNNDALLSPNLSAYEFGRPTPKSFQSSTIVPNKSTIVEDDETGGEEGGDESREEEAKEGEEESREGDAFGLEEAARTDFNENDNGSSPADTYQQQIKTLNYLLKSTEENLKQKDNELNNVTKNQTERVAQAETEKKEFKEQIVKLEARLADAQSLNEKLKTELDRVQAAHANENSDLQAQIQVLKASQVSAREIKVSSETERENESLKEDLIQQRRVAEDVCFQAQEILKEMRILSEQSRSSNEREEYLSKNIQRLEAEVKDWKEKYVKTKTKLKNFRGSSSDLAIQRDAARILSDSEFTDINGMIKDVNVIKFQISIDELLRSSRTEQLEKILELMKNVIYNVRNITQDIVEVTSSGEEVTLQQKKLKYNVTITAKNLITASKNFVAAKGLSPVSLLDAAASHLTSAIIELLRSVKIRLTPGVELESDDDMEDMSFIHAVDDSLVRKPDSENMVSSQNEISSKPFRGLGSVRLSTNSSMYSPISSPREEDPITPFSSNYDSWTNPKIPISQQSLSNGFRSIDSYPSMKSTLNVKARNNVEKLKIYLEDQTALLVQNVQSLVTAIRSESGITATGNSINAISDVVGNVIYNTEKAMIADKNSELRSQGEPVIRQLKEVQERLIEAGLIGRQIADEGRDDDESEKAWRSWNQSLPPIAFEIAREMKELVIRVDALDAVSMKDGTGID